jgi:glycosyltransferase involved in cell wall biosynthesis
MTPMPAAQVVHVITRLELGGAQEITLFSCRSLDPRRFDVHLVCGPGGLLDDEARAMPGVTVHFCDELVREVDAVRDARCLGSLTSLLRSIRRPGLPTIVHTHSSKAGILGRWAAVAARAELRIHSIHGFGFHGGQPAAVRTAFAFAERVTARITHAFCPVSEANLRSARAMGLLRGGQPAVLLPSGIDVDDYRPAPEDGPALRSELGIPSAVPVIGMIACLKPQKSPVDFVRIAAGVAVTRPDAHFFVAGDGELRDEMEREIDARGLRGRMHLLGWRRDVRRLLGLADVLVLPSLWEGLPRVALQAAAARKPMVATRVDGTPEVVEDGRTGYLLEPRDVGGFSERILRLIEDPGLRAHMGAEAYARVGRYDRRSMLEKLEGLYDQLLGRARIAA